MFKEELANQTVVRVKPKRKSKRTKAYTPAEDKLFCECWRDIGQDLKVGAEQKYSALWTRVHREFHERKKFPSYQMQSKHGWVSLSKRWRVIQQDCNKFCATYESIKARPVSGLDMQDIICMPSHSLLVPRIFPVDCKSICPHMLAWFEL